MNTKRDRLVVFVVSLALVGLVNAQDARPHIGIQLDPSPLSELLTKHLGLKPNQGIRICNVSVGSPADEIGLHRDDIIIGFQGRDITDIDAFVDAIQNAGVGTAVSLEVIHLGQRKMVEFDLTPMGQNPQWKYPREPQIITSWRPGRFFRIGPEGENWMEIPFEKVPDIDVEVKKFLQERYTYHHATDGEEYTIIIEGDPQDEGTRIIVQVDDSEYSATIGELETLPEKYHAAVEEALDSARQSSRQRLRVGKIPLPEPPDPDQFRRYFENLNVPMPDFDRWQERQNRMLERIEEQMERLQQRMEQLEKGYRDPGRGPQDEADEGSEPTGDTYRPVPKTSHAA